jgi:hypothetical protein
MDSNSNSCFCSTAGKQNCLLMCHRIYAACTSCHNLCYNTMHRLHQERLAKAKLVPLFLLVVTTAMQAVAVTTTMMMMMMMINCNKLKKMLKLNL